MMNISAYSCKNNENKDMRRRIRALTKKPAPDAAVMDYPEEAQVRRIIVGRCLPGENGYEYSENGDK